MQAKKPKSKTTRKYTPKTAGRIKAIVNKSSYNERRFIKSKFDAAQTTDDNTRHWLNADFLSANAALSPFVLRTLRNRSRYEVANNSYARGIIDTLANDTIGTGPRLQMLTIIPVANNKIERLFSEWSAEIGFASKLRTMRKARAQDGEGFAILSRNDNLKSPIKLDIKLVEADQITTPQQEKNCDFSGIDGIVYDTFGNPKSYYVLDEHPGGANTYSNDYQIIDAKSMIHWFKVDRPGQCRGIPEITPALPLFAQIRRYTLAVIAAAETAADFAAVLYTDTPPSGELLTEPESFDLIEIERRMATVLPEGWKLGQADAVQPTTTYVEFIKTILNEIARCLQVPFNIAIGNSSGYNYASGRLDHQTYYKNISVDQKDLEIICLDRILDAWFNEAILISGLLPPQWRTLSLQHQWFWDGREHVDPAKEANAQETKLGDLATNLSIEYSKIGRDWEVEIRQRAKEMELINSLGLKIETKPSVGKDISQDVLDIVEEK